MIGNRIQLARKAAGFSLRDLAEKINLTHTAINKYENNKLTPNSTMLMKLAKALGVKVEYFFRPETPTLGKVQYRDHHLISPKDKEIISAKIIDHVERRAELETLFTSLPIKSPVSPKISKHIATPDQVEDIAASIRKQWKLGLHPIPDLIDALETNGFRVFPLDFPRQTKFEGSSAMIDQMPVIIFNKNSPGDRQRFTIAHELGHLILGEHIIDIQNIETLCNRFAGSLLLPKESIINILSKHRNNIELMELKLLKEEFGISMTAILHRALECSIISEKIYKKIRKEFNKHEWDKIEPGDPYPEEKAHLFQQMVFHALAEDFIGLSKAAELLNMSLSAFKSLCALERPYATSHQ